ncbi:unnamed protein product [Prorocentrum cordatum]|uniref:Uncharacterized protein n=1 Tax=Prorocentrum cordatum TaxID=2364126 RepID=A0ABN9VS14_9DINO|nr:unnamed protein product [Polarella glacialis]
MSAQYEYQTAMGASAAVAPPGFVMEPVAMQMPQAPVTTYAAPVTTELGRAPMAPIYTNAPPVYMPAPTATTYAAPPAGGLSTVSAMPAQPMMMPVPDAMPGMVEPVMTAPVPSGPPVPVSTHTLPPVPQMPGTNVMPGNVTQVSMQAQVFQDRANCLVTEVQPTTTTVRELGQAVYVPGPTFEQDTAPEMAYVRTQQFEAGQVQQQIVEIPTITEEEIIQEIPEVQTVEIIRRCPR